MHGGPSWRAGCHGWVSDKPLPVSAGNIILRRPVSCSRRTALLSRPDGSGDPSYVTNFPARVIIGTRSDVFREVGRTAPGRAVRTPARIVPPPCALTDYLVRRLLPACPAAPRARRAP